MSFLHGFLSEVRGTVTSREQASEQSLESACEESHAGTLEITPAREGTATKLTDEVTDVG